MAGSADNIETYRQMLKLDRSSRVFALLAEELCAAGQWEEAAEVCKEGLLFHPDHLRARVLLGWAFMEMGEADQSERILLEAAADIRKNSIIFKWLSEFATFSGNPQSAGEYAGIHETFETLGPAPDEISIARPPELDRIEPGLTPMKEPSEPDNFEAEPMAESPGKHGVAASQSLPRTVILGPEVPVEEPQEPGMGTAAQETSEQEIDLKQQIALDGVLVHLAQRIEGRFTQKRQPAPILSEDDRNMLKQRIVAALHG